MERALLLTRGIVVFPGAKTEIEVGRTKSVNSIKLALKDKKIIICSQISPDIEDPKKEQIFEVGTLCSIVSSKELEDGDINVVVKGVKRVKVNDLIEHNHTLTCDYTELKETNITSKENTQKIKDIYSLVKESVTEMSKEEQDGLKGLFLGTPSASKITDYVAASITTIDLKTKQSILEETDVTKRLEKVASIMISPMDKQKIDNDISKKINETLSKQQKEFYLREKMKAVKSELGQISPKDNDVAALRKRAEEEPYPKEIKARVLEEIEKMEGAHPQEAAVSRSHIE
jgi:ATP-dependent Lon protease